MKAEDDFFQKSSPAHSKQKAPMKALFEIFKLEV